MRGRAALAGAALLAVVIVAQGSARPPSEQRLLRDEEFRPLIIDIADTDPTYAPPSLVPKIIVEPETPDPTRPPVKQPEVRAKEEPKATKPPATRHSARGVPTYYCRAGVSRCTRGYPDGPGEDFYAAAGPSLRVGKWRGRVVTVIANGKSIRVKLIDWCACGGNHFIDLYYDAFKELGFPSKATVKW